MANWFAGKSVLGIEVSPSQIKVVEAIPGSRPKILRAAAVGYFRGDQGTVSGQLRDLIVQHGFESKRAVVAVSGPSVVHGLVTLPPLKASEMRPVVERELRKIAPVGPGALATGYQTLGDSTQRGISKKRVLIAGASRAAVDQMMGLMSEAGLKVESAGILPVALLNATRLLSIQPEEGSVAFVNLGLETSHIVTLRGGELQFSREIAIGVGKGSLSGTGFVEKLVSEIKRTALYYRQNFRGEEIRRIILSGDDADLRRFTGPILDEVGIEVSIYDPTPALDLDAYKDGPVRFREIAHNFAVPLGLIYEARAKERINIVPSRVVRRDTGRLQRFAAGLMGLIFVVGLILAFVLVERQLDRRQQTIDALNSQIQTLQPQMQQIQEEQRLRDIHSVRLAFVKGTAQQGPVIAKALQELSLLVPDEMLFRNVNISKQPGRWQVNIDGEVVARDAPRAQAIFSRFFSELRAASLFYEAVLLQPLQVSSFEDSGRSEFIPPPPPPPEPQPMPAAASVRPSAPGVINIEVPQPPDPSVSASPPLVRRSRVEFKVGVSIASY